LNTVAAYSTGTITYQQSTLQVNLTGGTFPLWAGLGVIVINSVQYQVIAYISPTVVQLSTNSNPGVDIATQTPYNLYQDSYVLPCDCLAIDELINEINYRRLSFEQPREWLLRRRLNTGVAAPWMYTITGSERFFGSMAVRFYPPPDNIYPYDFMYMRRPRPLLLDLYNAGSITVTANTNTIAGTNTAWTPNMVGCAIRFTASATLTPTGLAGSNPYTYERVVTAVTAPNALTTDDVIPVTYTNTAYAISDPCDVEQGAMMTAFLRECEKQMRIARRIETSDWEEASYKLAMLQAREADARNLAPRTAGHQMPYGWRLANMPTGPDVP
jgi:hypothetical protein